MRSHPNKMRPFVTKAINRIRFFREINAIAGEFDSEFYSIHNSDVVATGVTPIVHFVQHGWREGRNPNSWFDVASYLLLNDDVRQSGRNPFVHYIRFGRKEGRPFAVQRAHNPSSAMFGVASAPVLVEGPAGYRALQASEAIDFFDAAYYRALYPDVAATGLDPWEHYKVQGWREGRNPSPAFETDFYLSWHPEVTLKDIDPLTHYVRSQGPNRRTPTRRGVFQGLQIAGNPWTLERPLLLPVSKFNFDASLRICVHIHCFYTEMLGGLLKAIEGMATETLILVSVPDQKAKTFVENNFSESHFRNYDVRIVPNRGRDLAPMLVTFKKEILSCDLALHLHTKRSLEKEDLGTEWFLDLKNKLLFNQGYINRIIRAFQLNKKLGALEPRPFEKIVPFMKWGRNRSLVEKLMSQMSLPLGDFLDGDPRFPAGSMFWFRPAALKRMFDLNLTYDAFPREPISDDGTIAHALERCLTEVIRGEGFHTREVAPLSYEASRPLLDRPKVSVIIPVFNGLKWLEAAVHSVLTQDAMHVGYELIIVDNNSTDGSYELAQGLYGSHPNIRILRQMRKGAGAARNMGLAAAKGAYVIFLDVDDLLLSNAFGILTALIERSKDLDFVASSLVMFNENTYQRPMPFGGGGWYQVVDSEKFEDAPDAWRMILSDMGPCAKLYKREFLCENNIFFPEGRNFEDNLFVVDVYFRARRVGVVSTPTYLYRRYRGESGNTQSTSRNPEAARDQVWVAEEIERRYKFLPNHPLHKALRHAIAQKMRDEAARFDGAVAAKLASVARRFS